ncbi:ATPase [Bacillus mycoides]|uniref:ATPase n=1 Tax=Bacillus mycoides TaxID=1405 RepID=UPI001C0332BA|nr:ATPase [Bacillus mycoides]QWG64085.1 ATPase [Bacillus mycoides]QWG90304.1 ATPase [Bacillus mycoides]QWJ04153.1 ATPase [Bacillus mycoides]
MIFSQNIIVAHEEDWTKYDVEKALKGCHAGPEVIFMGLKELVKRRGNSYKG